MGPANHDAMTSNDPSETDQTTPARPLSDAAGRALAEAEARRRDRKAGPASKEIGGRDGPEPVRYGDWEVKGIASDF